MIQLSKCAARNTMLYLLRAKKNIFFLSNWFHSFTKIVCILFKLRIFSEQAIERLKPLCIACFTLDTIMGWVFQLQDLRGQKQFIVGSNAGFVNHQVCVIVSSFNYQIIELSKQNTFIYIGSVASPLILAVLTV